MQKFSFSTDTATLSIFDFISLNHRVNDTPDWWSIPSDEIDEINNGNVLFFNLGEDGDYFVEVVDNIKSDFKNFF